MISAATAATAVLMVTLVKDHGLQYLLAATVLAGLLQIGAGLLKLGFVMRFVVRYIASGGNAGLIQSVVLGTGMLVVGVLVALIGVLADISAKHRQLTEETLYRLKKMELREVAQGSAEDTQKFTGA